MMLYLCGIFILISTALVDAQTCGNGDGFDVTPFEIASESYIFTGSYPADTECTWTFKGSSGNKLIFQVLDINIGADDTLTAFDGATIEFAKTKILNGKSSVETLTSTTLTINFQSGPSSLPENPELGFRIFVTEGSDKSEIGNTNPPPVRSLTAETDKKILTSPLFPEKYTISTTWQWDITASNAIAIEIELIFLDLEIQATCKYDHIEITGGGMNVKNCSKLWQPDQTITIPGEEATLKLVSDAFDPAHGFILSYRAIPKKELGETCNGDNECADPKAKCDGTCECVSPDVPIDGTCQLPTKNLTDACTDENECIDPKAECDEICKCTSPYVNIDGTCKLGLGGDCSSETCAVENSRCCDDVCVCKRNYHQVGESCEPFPTKKLGESCTDVNECIDPKAECDGTCKCPNPYNDIHGTCKLQICMDKEIYCASTQQCYCKPNSVKIGSKCYSCYLLKRYRLGLPRGTIYKARWMCRYWHWRGRCPGCASLPNMRCCNGMCYCAGGYVYDQVHGRCVRRLYVRSTAKVIYGREKLRKKEKPERLTQNRSHYYY